MSFLTPLLLAGLAAIALPIILHLSRNKPKNRMEFSSLMFLEENHTVTRRRLTLKDILLLALRCLAIALLAFAFARPYILKDDQKGEVATGEVLNYILIDNSASMRGEPLELALQKAKALINETKPRDQIAISTFSSFLTPLITPETAQNTPPSLQKRNALSVVNSIQESWLATHLGKSLAGANSLTHAHPSVKLHVISDFQKGGSHSSVEEEFWGGNIQVIPHVITRPPSWTNAGIHLMPGNDALPTVRVMNSAGSSSSDFTLQWGSLPPLKITIPPGEVATFKAPQNIAASGTVRISGDHYSFDNEAVWIPITPRKVEVYYPGHIAASNPDQAAYYLERALRTNKTYQVNYTTTAPAPITHLALATAEGDIQTVLENGGHVLFPIEDAKQIEVLAKVLSTDVTGAKEAPLKQHALLGEVDFKSPVFSPFADPRYSDFSKIRIWRHRVLPHQIVKKGQILASFDNGSPAWVQFNIGKGVIHVLTTTWRPVDSQLALSPKFPTLMNHLLQQSVGENMSAAYTLINSADAPPGLIETPQGPSVIQLAQGETNLSAYTQKDLLNLGIPLEDLSTRVNKANTKKPLSVEEIESQQRIGWWALIAVAFFILIETAVSALPRNLLKPKTA